MNAYEITFIVRPDLDDDSIDAVVDQVLGRIQAANGEIIATLPWNPARRRMAYPIRDFGDGVYITVTFRVESQALREIETTFKLNERILRFLIVQATDQAVKQAQQRLQQRATAAAAPPPAPAHVATPMTAPPSSAAAPPAEVGAVAEVLAAQTGAELEADAAVETAPGHEAPVEPEPVAAAPSVPTERTEE